MHLLLFSNKIMENNALHVSSENIVLLLLKHISAVFIKYI